MTLIEQIRTQSLTARQSRLPIATFLTTLLSEAEMVGKNKGNRETTEAETLAVVRKFLAGNTETLSGLDPADPRHAALTHENIVLNSYLPKQLTEQELRDAIAALAVSFPGLKLGDAMKHLKAAHDGYYDAKLASTIAREVLA